jgi:hypothetical protein
MWHVERARVWDKEREIKHLADALKEMEEREESREEVGKVGGG